MAATSPSKHSYGLLPFRRTADSFEVLIGHMGGPFWARKDERAWSIPKGLPESSESPLNTARREFMEEIGVTAPTDGFRDLGEIQQSGGKRVTAWAVEIDIDIDDFSPGTFEMEWPPRSGTLQTFPEVDRIAWVDPDQARRQLVAAQTTFVDRLDELLG